MLSEVETPLIADSPRSEKLRIPDSARSYKEKGHDYARRY